MLLAGYYPLLEHALSIFFNCVLESYNYYREFEEKILPMLEEKVEENGSLKVLQVESLSTEIGHADIFRSLHFGVLKNIVICGLLHILWLTAAPLFGIAIMVEGVVELIFMMVDRNITSS
jgi:hypothetical protein